MRVLAVDDEPLARTALRNILAKRADIEEFDVVDDARQALSSLRAHPYDLLLLDIHMPELSGLELLERVAKQHRPIPAVVFVTAYHQHAVEAFRRRAIDYVIKPFSPARVHDALNAAVRRSAEERAARLIETLRQLRFAPDGRLFAYSADKGEKLLEVQTGLKGGMGPPITYMLDGKQYIALAGGMGNVVNNFQPPPPPPGGGAAGAPPPPPPANNVMPKLLVFALDAKGTLPVGDPAK